MHLPPPLQATDTQRSFEQLPRPAQRTGGACPPASPKALNPAAPGGAQPAVGGWKPGCRAQKNGDVSPRRRPSGGAQASPTKAANTRLGPPTAAPISPSRGPGHTARAAGGKAISPSKTKAAVSLSKASVAKSRRRSAAEKGREARGAVLPQSAAARLAQARVYTAAEDDPFRSSPLLYIEALGAVLGVLGSTF